MLLASFAVALFLTPAGAPSAAKDQSAIVWIHDDWKKAKDEAIAAHQLVAIDVWATWCHSCLSMKAYVLGDKAMAPAAKLHTWLMVDFDRPENAALFQKIPVGALPTFLVVDPTNDTVVSRWVGTGTARQMAEFFINADQKARDPLALGQRALAREDYAGARATFEAALKKPSKDKALRTRLLSGYIEALQKLDPKTCAEIGASHLAEVEDSAPGMDFVSIVATCASDLDSSAKGQVLARVIARLVPVAERGSAKLSVDDRSGVYEALTEAYDALGKKDEAENAVAARGRLLDDAAARATSDAERATFDAHRLDVDLRLGKFVEAEKMLLASEHAQPEDFNHPWRLARLYAKQGRSADGLAAIERALQRGYGARKLRLYTTKVDLLIQKKSFDDARHTVAQAKSEVANMNPSQVRPSWVKELDAKLEQIAKLEKSS